MMMSSGLDTLENCPDIPIIGELRTLSVTRWDEEGETDQTFYGSLAGHRRSAFRSGQDAV